MRKLMTGVLAIATVWMFMRATEMGILMQQEIWAGHIRKRVSRVPILKPDRDDNQRFLGLASNVLGRDGCALADTDLHSLRR